MEYVEQLLTPIEVEIKIYDDWSDRLIQDLEPIMKAYGFKNEIISSP